MSAFFWYLGKVTCEVYTCTIAYTGQVTFYGHAYLVTLYLKCYNSYEHNLSMSTMTGNFKWSKFVFRSELAYGALYVYATQFLKVKQLPIHDVRNLLNKYYFSIYRFLFSYPRYLCTLCKYRNICIYLICFW